MTGVGRVDRSFHDPPQAFVLTDVAEALPVQGRRLDDLEIELRDLGERIRGRDEREGDDRGEY